MVFHLAITTVAGYKRKYLDGLTLLCMVVMVYVFAFERFIMPLLASLLLTDPQSAEDVATNVWSTNQSPVITDLLHRHRQPRAAAVLA